MANLLRMTDISKTFGGIHALRNVDFELNKGEVHALLGENGAGKSTLIKILSGVYQADSGEIALNGQAITVRDPAEACHLGISTIFQELNVVPELTVAENMMLGREPVKTFFGMLDRAASRKKCREVLETLHISLSLDTPVRKLNTAMQQMVEIGRALLIDAKIIVMDEPTASLSEAEVESLFKLVGELKEKGVSIIYISHRLEEVISICDRATILRNGEVTAECQREELSLEKIIKNMVGYEVKERYPKEQHNIGKTVLEVRSLGADNLFSQISFKVRAGEILGLSGLVGSKRTDVVQAIFGADHYDEGEIFLDGEKLPPGNVEKAIESGIALIPEERKKQGLVMGLSIKKNIALPQLKSISRLGVINLWEETKIAEHMGKQLQIKAGSLEQEVQDLSGGNQQKVVLAKWLYTKPKLVILDEPTRGIDIGAKIEVYRLINNLAAEGVAIILVSSELPEIMGMSDNIIVMSKGKITGTFKNEEVTEEEILACAFETQGRC
ncbi:MAG TPA: sugar ABC transporter ATP-binding protein [Firmicutes bacterium]|jgi:ribose transport system ATP-binding protein|nr:sugar ABC transporter ATP-binding protein [Bacillota bacterium]